jgi:hypothetical protein
MLGGVNAHRGRKGSHLPPQTILDQQAQDQADDFLFAKMKICVKLFGRKRAEFRPR